jgi:hypothetical protein
MRNKPAQKRIKRGWILLLAILLLSPQSSFAESYFFDFTGDLYVWDISGSYTDDSTGLNISYVLTQDAQGKLTGSGSASCSVAGVDVDISFDITGSIKQTGGIAIVKMSFKFRGTAYDGYDTYKFTASAKATAEINLDSGTVEGTVKVKVSIKGYGSESYESPYTLELPPDMDGAFTLDLNVNEAGRKLQGTGELVLSSGDIYYFSVTGKYNSKTDESSFTLKGDGSSKGCSLKIKVDESDDSITSLTGKVLGQKIKGMYD